MSMNENYIEKPEGKPVKAFRARVKVFGNDVVEVNPETPKESNRKMIKQKGKLLYDTPLLKVYLNKTQKKVVIQTTLDCGPTIERELLQLQGDMGRVIGANYSEIIKVFNSKTGKSKEPSYPTVEEIIDRV